MCRSKGKCLVINACYHTNILFTVRPFSYITMYLSWFGTSYSCPPFTVSMWSYHWRSRYPLALAPLHEWTYNSPQHTSRYCHNYYFGEWSTCSKGGLPPFSSPH
jgi:hypothetical protein